MTVTKVLVTGATGFMYEIILELRMKLQAHRPIVEVPSSPNSYPRTPQ